MTTLKTAQIFARTVAVTVLAVTCLVAPTTTAQAAIIHEGRPSGPPAQPTGAPHSGINAPFRRALNRSGSTQSSVTAVPGVALTNLAGTVGNQNPSPGPASAPALQVSQDASDLSIGGGNLYAWDQDYSVLRKIDLSSGTETIALPNEGSAGHPVSGLTTYGVYGAEADSTGNIYAFESYGCDSCARGISDSLILLIPSSTSSSFLPGQSLVAGHTYVLAGGGSYTASGDFGDGATATSAVLDGANHILIDASGNLLVDEQYGIRLVAGATSDKLLPGKTLKPGDIYTVAGNGQGTFSCNPASDGSEATSEPLDSRAIAVTPAGNLLVSDFCGGLRLISGTTTDPLIPGTTLTPGDIYTVTSNLESLGGSGLAVDSAGDAYISDSDPNWGTPWIKIVAAGTSNPFLPGQTLVPGRLYTVAGGISAESSGFNGDGLSPTKTTFYGLQPFVLDGSNTIVVADGNRIREISATSGTVTTIAGTGLTVENGVAATTTSLSAGQALQDANGDIILPDSGSVTIRLIAGGTTSPFLPGRTLVKGDVYPLSGPPDAPYTGAPNGSPAAVVPLPPTQGGENLALDAKGNLIVGAYPISFINGDNSGPQMDLIAATTSDPLLPGRTLTPGNVYHLAFADPEICQYTNSGIPGPATDACITGYGFQPVMDKSGNLLLGESSGCPQNVCQILLVAASTSDSLMPGKTLKAGDIYVLAGGGSPASPPGLGGPATDASFAEIDRLAVATNGNLYIDDEQQARILAIAAATTDPLMPGQTLTPGDLYDVAGNGTYGRTTNWPGPASSETVDTNNMVLDPNGDLYVDEGGSNGGLGFIPAASTNILANAGSGYAGMKFTPGDIYSIGWDGFCAPDVECDGFLSSFRPDGTALTVSNYNLGLLALVPSVPTHLKITASGGKLTLRWDAPAASGSTAITGYQVLRDSNGDQETTPYVTTTGIGTSFVDGKVIPGGDYTYQVQAVTADGDSVPTDWTTATALPSTPPKIATIVGEGAGPKTGLALQLGQQPDEVAVSATTVYTDDSRYHVIHALNLKTRTETVIAGDGVSGDTGNNGLATKAEIHVVGQMAVDSKGNLLFPAGQGGVRLVANATTDPLLPGKTLKLGYIYVIPSTLEQIAGGYIPQPSSVTVDSHGDLLLADLQNCAAELVPVGTSSPFLAGMALKAGSLYPIAGAGSCSDTGDGGSALSANLANPQALALDKAGNLLVGTNETGCYYCSPNSRLRLIATSSSDPLLPDTTLTPGDIYLVGGGGTTTSAGAVPFLSLRLPGVQQMAFTSTGDLVVETLGSCEVRLLAANTADPLLPHSTLKAGAAYDLVDAGQSCIFGGDGGPAPAATFDGQGLAIDTSNDLYVADTEDGRLRVVSATTGKIATVAGRGSSDNDGISASQEALNQPDGMVSDAKGNLYIADWKDEVVRVVARSTSIGLLPGKKLTAGDIYTVAGTGTVPDCSSCKTIPGIGGPATSSPLKPESIAIDPAGNLLIGDDWWSDIRLVAIGKADPLLPGKILKPGHIYDVYGGLGDFYKPPVSGVKATGSLANIANPCALATDSKGNLYVSDCGINTYGSYVVMVAAGKSTTFLPGQALVPGNMYILAGGASNGDSGDGGPALTARFQDPDYLAVDSSGGLLIGDFGNSELRLLAASSKDTVLASKKLIPGDVYPVAGTGQNDNLFPGVKASSISLDSSTYGLATDPSGNISFATNSYGDQYVWIIATNKSDRLLPGAKLTPGDIYRVAGGDEYNGSTGDGGPALVAGFGTVRGVSFDRSGNLYILDSDSLTIREVSVPQTK